MKNEKSIEILNKLVEINNDRIEGYETALKETKESYLKALFSQLAYTSQKCKTELITEVHKLGGQSTEGTKVTGKFFRIWMDVKAELMNNDRKAILNSCEFGEDVAIGTYEKILNNNLVDISADQRTMLYKQLALIKIDHDTIKDIRDDVMEVK